MSAKILINRAPVLTLWATVVAQRLGFTRNEALSLGKALAGLTAQSKGRRLGIYKASQKKDARGRKQGETILIGLLGRSIAAQSTPDGLRAMNKEKAVTPESVQKYLASKFGEDLDDVVAAMTALAKSRAPTELEETGFKLYEQFRPAIPSGAKGWGAKGELSLKTIARLEKSVSRE